MSAVVGIDLSSFVIDLVKLDESSDRAEWVRVELVGKTAWERTLSIRENMTLGPPRTGDQFIRERWWDDVYLVAIEAPMGYGSNKLDRVVGAVASSLPAALRRLECCWVVQPQEWKSGLGLKDKPTKHDVGRLAGVDAVGCIQPMSNRHVFDEAAVQNARDAYCIAMWARRENAKGIAA